MANVLDVAAYILEKQGPMTTWKLQKLVYYAQGWSTVWDDAEIFPEEIEAWANGPVVRELYERHRHQFRLSAIKGGNPSQLTSAQAETVDAVLAYYGDKSSQWLSDLTHMEDPWRKARRGIPEGDRGNTIIRKQDLAEYYGGLQAE